MGKCGRWHYRAVSKHDSILGTDGLDVCVYACIVKVMVDFHEVMVCSLYCHA